MHSFLKNGNRFLEFQFPNAISTITANVLIGKAMLNLNLVDGIIELPSFNINKQQLPASEWPWLKIDSELRSLHAMWIYEV